MLPKEEFATFAFEFTPTGSSKCVLLKPLFQTRNMADGGRSSEGPVPMQGPRQDYGPLPDFVLNWGNSVQRPPYLPEKYDDRIPSAFIFAFPFHPLTGAEGWFYVVPKGCTHCQKLKQRCDRGSPCGRCSCSGNNCVRVGEKWDELPGVKISKSGNTKMDPVRSYRGGSHSAPPVPRTVGGRTLRSQQETPSYIEAQISSPEVPLRPKIRSKKRAPLDDPFIHHFQQKKSRTQLHEKPKFRRGPKRVVSAPVPQTISFCAPIGETLLQWVPSIWGRIWPADFHDSRYTVRGRCPPA